MALADKIKQLAQEVAGDVKALQGEMSGKQPLSPTLTNTTASFTSALNTKLSGIQEGAQVNPSSTDGVPEGTRLYFTNARAISAIKSDADWKATNWDAAYSWGSHAGAGYATQVWVNGQIADIEGGDVTGPSASTDNAIPVFDGVTGKALKESRASIGVDGDFRVTARNEMTAFTAMSESPPAAHTGAGIVGGSVAEPVAIGDRLGFFLFRAGTINAAGMEGYATQPWAWGAKGTKLRFVTTQNGQGSRTPALELEHDKRAIFYGPIHADAIEERTANAGVTIDGVPIKDGLVDGRDVSVDGAKLDGLATVATSGAYADLSGKPTLSAVATSGSYNDLSNKPTIPAGTVTSVQVATPTGLSVTGGPVTTSGTLTISYASGYAIPTTTKQGQWDTAYGWGNHASAGYATTTTLTSGLSGKVDKQTGYGLSQENYSITEKNKLSGIESGAQVNTVPIDNLTTPDATVPLSASQGRVLKGLIDGINTILQSDDTNLDELQEIVDYIKLNRGTLDSLSIGSIAGLSDALNNKQPLASVLTNTSASFTSALLTKLNGIATGATANTGTVTSVQASAPTGLSVSGGPITSSGTLAFSYTAGYSIPTNAKQGQWDSAYGWGNHASAGYATTSALTSGLSGKVNTQAGYGLSQENYTLAEKNKLNGIASGATNTAAPVQTDWNATSGLAAIQNKPTIPTIPGVATTSANGLMSSGDKTKLNGIATGATANSLDAHLLARSNHSGTQAASTITGLATVATSGSFADLDNKPTIPTLPATVAQAEAEARTASTARLWTAQRVGQAITAWWGTITQASIRTKAGIGTNAEGNRTVSTDSPSGGSNGDVWFQVED